MFIRIILVLLATCLAGSSRSEGLKDPRLIPITQQELERFVEQTPISDLHHGQILSRSLASELSRKAYDLYTLRWKEHPNDADANYLRGMAALACYLRLLQTETSTATNDMTTLFEAAYSCLSKAVKLAPNSSRIQAKYGHFLWRYQGQWAAGLSHIKKAISLDPKNALGYSELGDLLSCPADNGYYNPTRALEQLRKAAELDPSFAYPHYSMAMTYVLLKQYPAAQAEIDAYLRLAPAKMAGAAWITPMQAHIKQQLDKQSANPPVPDKAVR